MSTDFLPDIDAAHAAVQGAIRAGAPAGLDVLGFGEMTLVIGWPTAAPTHAVKRLPPFTSRARLDGYVTLVYDYVAALGERGVRTVPTRVDAVAGPHGTWCAYLVQPLAAPGRMLDVHLRTAGAADGRAALERLAAIVAGAADARVGLDGQVSNWAIGDDGDLRLVDLTTPLLCDASGRERIDTALFTAVYPWVLRAALRRFVAPGVMRGFHDPRTILTDAGSNLLRQNLDAWVPVLLEAAATHVHPAIVLDDVRAYYRSDTRLWGMTERLRRAERWWQRRVRRRPYPMLLAPPGAIRPPRTGALA